MSATVARCAPLLCATDVVVVAARSPPEHAAAAITSTERMYAKDIRAIDPPLPREPPRPIRATGVAPPIIAGNGPEVGRITRNLDPVPAPPPRPRRRCRDGARAARTRPMPEPTPLRPTHRSRRPRAQNRAPCPTTWQPPPTAPRSP